MIPWNPCPPSRGIRAHLAVEFVPAIAWNSHSEADIQTIADTYHRWRGKPETVAALGLEPYADQPGFCRAASLEEVRASQHVLTPGRYVGAADTEDDGVAFTDRFGALRADLAAQFEQGRTLEARINAMFGSLVSS